MRYALAAALALIALPAIAEPSPVQCRQAAKDAAGAADGMDDLLAAVKQRDGASFAVRSSGDVKGAIYRFEESRQRLIPALREYTEAMHELSRQFRLCAH